MDYYVGKRLDGRYEIRDIIGVGGMAVVYKAYDNIDDRIVAVKILKEEYSSNAEFLRRFKNESRAISVLSHPNIVKVYNVKYGDKLQYIVMEYVEGITLKEYIEQQGRLGIKETIYFTIQILRALQHAHDKGIIHRDVKPQNIMLLSNGTIKVTDFGIARFSYSDTKTMTDSAIGSVHYISPEQARGRTADERADIYSVGVALYEMLTGQLPFTSENSVSVALMQLQSVAKSPREINPNIPVGLEQIITRAMEKDPKVRYQTASEMLNDIEEFKNNPNVRFKQNYFVDKEPTKFADSKQVREIADKADAIAESNQSAQNSSGRKKSRSNASVIGVGIGVGLLLVGVIVFVALNMFTDVFQKGSLTVPQFIGKYYEADIVSNPNYASFKIEPVYVENENIEDGQVFSQSPNCNQKLASADQVIKVYVAQNVKQIAVPDVYDLTWEQAETLLQSKGFVVNLLSAISTTKEFGTVIKTVPEKNTMVDSGSIITVYYASDEDLIEVPKLTGYDLETAKSLAESVKLTVEESAQPEPSDMEKGLVCSQNPAQGDKVLPGTKVILGISNGAGKKIPAELTINLPAKDLKGNIEVFVNNESVASKRVLLDGGTYTCTIEGNGENASVKVFIDNSEYYSCKMDFTAKPIVPIDGKYSATSIFKKALPDVKGMSMTQAQDALKDAGFYNVKVETEVVYSQDEDGKVLSQSPSASTQGLIGYNTYATDTVVTIVVGQMDGVNT